MLKKPTDIKLILSEASEKPTIEERSVYLDRVCGDDVCLRQEVESLLQMEDKVGDFLESPILDPAIILDESPLAESPGTVIGRYKLLEKIGEGGMAVVYMAEQQEPIRRRIALKIIKLGMDTKSVITRFEAERQALAMMDHPNIAKVFDAGATDTGRPYFVMELVHGLSVTEYSDKNRLDTRQRLKLFVQVCQAVQHAHQKGIIHRDIKPSNVLVTTHDDKPVPKVIDFGIAKATNQRLTEKTLFTRYAHIIGTPAYMSPEQAEMSDIGVDTRTDIYSLGVLLYELLTGTTPFGEDELREAGFLQMQKIICEKEPTKPSTKLNTLGKTLTEVAKRRNSSPELMPKLIRGDLDWIIMKCLEKDRGRRYETVYGLSEDIERHLNNEPILARSPSFVYRAQKFWRRHRLHFATAAIVTLLLTALVVITMMYRRALNLRWAKAEALPKVVELAKEENYVEAFSLAQKARKFIPEDPTLIELWPRISKDYSITTIPVGADIYCREYAATDEPWQYLGRSPLENITLPQGTYRCKIEKKGFDTHECVTDRSFDIRLQEENWPGEMVWIGGVYDDSGNIKMPEFLIDKYEVTNEQFKVFVDAGGYESADYWDGLEFVKDGHRLSWQEAMTEFRDRTGQPGPATWEGGTYPEGQGKHPVSGISWYEAAAYTEFVGKSLPTIHHWQGAACLEESIVIIPFSNFSLDGTAPVGSHPGIGTTGLYDMAGNVKEWCWNATDDPGSHRYILGGAWGEQTYMFTERDLQSPWDRSPVNGFRCIQYPEGEESAANTLFDPLKQHLIKDFASIVPLSDEEFQIYKDLYEYDRTNLNPMAKSTDDHSPIWRKEKITFDAAYGGERVTAYLFLPKTVKPPYQTVIYFPGSSATQTRSFKDLPQKDFTEFIIMSGRALLYPVYKGTYERPPTPGLETSIASAARSPMAHRDWVIQMSKDLRRSVDYLETRDDIDEERMAYYGFSWGAFWGSIMLALEDRFKAAVFVVGGFYVWGELPAAMDPVTFAPKVKTPVLMVNGKEDFFFPLRTSQIPMYELLGTAHRDKQHKLYPGGHGLFGLFSKQIRGDVLAWLDRYLGPADGKQLRE